MDDNAHERNKRTEQRIRRDLYKEAQTSPKGEQLNRKEQKAVARNIVTQKSKRWYEKNKKARNKEKWRPKDE